VTVHSDANFAAQLLLDARLQRRPLAELPRQARPSNADEAYRCRARVVDRLLDHYGGEIIGYKIACTNEIAQRFLHMPEPFYGSLLSAFTSDSPVCLEASGFFMRVIESEFAFRLGADLPPGPGAATREEIAAAIEGVLPSIEIVDSRFTNWTNVGAPSLIADNACHGAWVKGALVNHWRELDLAAQAVELAVNGNVVQRGSGAAVLGHPLNALEWLVRRLHSEGIGLKAGQYVTTGVTTDIYQAQSGDRIVASFGPVGKIELAFV
jgi:2-keto-4-pentenoate hydratase